MASGADVLELATDDDLLQSLMRFADLRRQRARLKLPRRFPAHMARARAAVTAETAATATPDAGQRPARPTVKVTA